MKYLLVVGFACEVYKKEPRARIFVGGQLLDEFYISYHKDTLNPAVKKFLQNRHILQPFSSIEEINTQIKNFPPLRFYEIEIDQQQNQLDIHIDINNNDNNYTNGFMTASTLLQLQILHFFPLEQKLLSKLNKIKNKSQFSKNYSSYRNIKNIIFNLITNEVEWHGKNKQIIKNTPTHRIMLCTIGGDGQFVSKLIKKYGIFIPRLIRSYRYSFNILLINYLLDKYHQHANQRNTD